MLQSEDPASIKNFAATPCCNVTSHNTCVKLLAAELEIVVKFDSQIAAAVELESAPCVCRFERRLRQTLEK